MVTQYISDFIHLNNVNYKAAKSILHKLYMPTNCPWQAYKICQREGLLMFVLCSASENCHLLIALNMISVNGFSFSTRKFLLYK